jgi:hypothetical protein
MVAQSHTAGRPRTPAKPRGWAAGGGTVTISRSRHPIRGIALPCQAPLLFWVILSLFVVAPFGAYIADPPDTSTTVYTAGVLVH